MRLLIATTTVIAALGSGWGHRAAADDVVVLNSGNRMTGEVVEFARGALTFAIDGAGRVDINWSNVETLESMQRMDVELASGERFSGQIRSPSAGTLEVAADAGAATIDMRDIVRITPIRDTFVDRTEGSFDLGFDLLSANDELDWTMNADVAHRMQRYLTELSIESLVRRFDDTTLQRRNHLDLRSRRFLANRWFVLGLLELEENRELDLTSRVLIGGAIGRTLRQTNRTIVSVYAGLDYDRERYREVPGTQDDTELVTAVEWDWFEVGGDTELETEAAVFSSLDRSRTRTEIDVTLRRAIVRGYYWSMTLYGSHDSDAPEGLEDHGFGLAVTAGREF